MNEIGSRLNGFIDRVTHNLVETLKCSELIMKGSLFYCQCEE